MFKIQGDRSALFAAQPTEPSQLNKNKKTIALAKDFERLKSKSCFYDMPWDDPLQYLALVRLNQSVQLDLIRIDESEKERALSEKLAQVISQGYWDSERLQIDYFEYVTESNDSTTHLQDLLFYAYWRGDISKNEFYTSMHFINCQKQFSKECGDIKLSVIPILNENGNINEAAKYFFTSLVENYKKRRSERTEEWLLQYTRSCPKHLLFVTKLEFKKYENTEHDEYIDHAIRCHVMLKEQGYFSVGEDEFELKNEEKVFKSFTVLTPSFGLIESLLEGITPNKKSEEIVKPIMYLGAAGPQKLATLHLSGYHPVAALDTRVHNGMDTHIVHTFVPGPLFLAEHDTSFHLPFASQYHKSQIELLCNKIPFLVNQLIDEEEGLDIEIKESLTNNLNDMIDLARYEKDSIYWSLIILFNSCKTGDFQFKFFSRIRKELSGILANDHEYVKPSLDAIQKVVKYDLEQMP